MKNKIIIVLRLMMASRVSSSIKIHLSSRSYWVLFYHLGLYSTLTQMVNRSCGYTHGKSSPCDVLKRPALPLLMPGESSTIQ